VALSAALVPAVLGLYRNLLYQFYQDVAVIIRYAGSPGRITGPRGVVKNLPRLFCRALPAKPLSLPFRFFVERDDPDPFVPPQRTSVPAEVTALLGPPIPLVPLTYPGVIKLQEAICRRELSRCLDLRLDPGDSATVLGRFGGVDRILSSLLTAAGGRRALASREELAHRLKVVLPLFLQILGMQGSVELKFPVRKFRWRKRRQLEKKKRQFLTFSQSLYPQAIEEARGRIVRENRIRRWRGHLHHLEVLREEYRFRLYIGSLDLLPHLEIGKDQLAEAIERLGWNYDN
jgi:hypothetical protein